MILTLLVGVIFFGETVSYRQGIGFIYTLCVFTLFTAAKQSESTETSSNIWISKFLYLFAAMGGILIPLSLPYFDTIQPFLEYPGMLLFARMQGKTRIYYVSGSCETMLQAFNTLFFLTTMTFHPKGFAATITPD